MPEFADQELIRLIEKGESDRVEFKEAMTGDAAKAIRKAICAFANDLPGHGQPGVVFVGVKDDGTISGLQVTDQLLLQLADMKTDGNIVPPPSLTVEKRTLQGKDVAVVTVQPSNSPPVRFKGVVHIRTGSRQDTATAQDEVRLREKRVHGDRPFDLQPIPTAGLTDLNLAQFENEYLAKAVSAEVRAANDRNIEERLAATKMVHAAANPVATVLGVLTIGNNPQDFLPGAWVQFLKIDSDRYDDNAIVDDVVISGAISDLLRGVDEKLNSHNRVTVEFAARDIEQRTELYPAEALRQIVRNAVMHRTYEGTNSPVRITWYQNHIEVLSPGGPYGMVNANNFGQPNVTDYRNPNLAEAMRTLGYVQRFGMGILIANRQLKEAGHPKLEFDLSSGNFVLVKIKARQNSGGVKS
ncbi:MAG: putative DNA binding domain-containing protein [Gammaproteobacteria bacterium]|nr:putative DNA binding domain-containing protein [Gammaproteobacteria bacterium]